VGLLGICVRGREDPVGFCGFDPLEGADELELAYELVPELWGRRFAAEAARACFRYAFEEAGLRNLATLRVR
jgi:[ribosomal protein S5]-alanine N-acetyltransferase